MSLGGPVKSSMLPSTILIWMSSHHLWVSSGMIDRNNTFMGDVSAGSITQNFLSSCLACMQICQQQKPHFNMRAEGGHGGGDF